MDLVGIRVESRLSHGLVGLSEHHAQQWWEVEILESFIIFVLALKHLFLDLGCWYTRSIGGLPACRATGVCVMAAAIPKYYSAPLPLGSNGSTAALAVSTTEVVALDALSA